jgi:hypothetical protein
MIDQRARPAVDHIGQLFQTDGALAGFTQRYDCDIMVGNEVGHAAIFVQKQQIKPDIAILKEIFDWGIIEATIAAHDGQKPNSGGSRTYVAIDASAREGSRLHLGAQIKRAKRVEQKRQSHEHIGLIWILTGLMQQLRQSGSVDASDVDRRQYRGDVQIRQPDLAGRGLFVHGPVRTFDHKHCALTLGAAGDIDKSLVKLDYSARIKNMRWAGQSLPRQRETSEHLD